MRKFTPKIKRIKRRYGEAIICLIVSYYRNNNSTPMHDILKAYPTIRSTDVESLRVRAAFWSVVEKDLLEYVHNGILTNDQATKIRERFALYIKPFVAAVMPKIKPVSRASKVDLEKRFPVLGSAIK